MSTADVCVSLLDEARDKHWKPTRFLVPFHLLDALIEGMRPPPIPGDLKNLLGLEETWKRPKTPEPGEKGSLLFGVPVETTLETDAMVLECDRDTLRRSTESTPEEE